MKLLFLLPFLFGCAGSPNIIIEKNIYVIINGAEAEDGHSKIAQILYPIEINIEYSTESSTKSDADISQEGELKIPIPIP